MSEIRTGPGSGATTKEDIGTSGVYEAAGASISVFELLTLS
jgi:hypothetical protein